MFLALVASTLAAVLLLLWCYWLNRCERSLLWMAAGFFLASSANLLLAGRATLPVFLTIDVGVAVLLIGIGLTWTAMRVFNGRPASVWVPLAGPILWLLACAVPAFHESAEARVVLGSTIAAGYFLAAAREIALKDGLRTRFAVSLVLVIHSAFVLLRIPLVLMDGSSSTASFQSNWFGPATFETAIFIQVIAFLMVSLTKERVENQLRSAALTDPLTGLGNRRGFFELGEAVVAQNARKGRTVAAIIFDLDRFKEVNDRYGHPVGDAVIQTFARTAMKRLRAGDVVGRLGGEEFAVLLPETTALQAGAIAEYINGAFESAVVELAHTGLRCTASAGVAASPMASSSLERLLTVADRALYEAKGNGGAQVCHAPTSDLLEIEAA